MRAAASEPPPPGEPDLEADLRVHPRTLSPMERIARHDVALELVLALRASSPSAHGLDTRAAAAAGLAAPRPRA